MERLQPVFAGGKNTLSILAIWVFVLAFSSAAGFQQRERLYVGYEHRALIGHSFMYRSGISKSRCSVLCLRDDRCLSFNYNDIGGTCQINDASADEFPESFHQDAGFSYFVSEAKSTNGNKNTATVAEPVSASTAAEVTTNEPRLTTADSDQGMTTVPKQVTSTAAEVTTDAPQLTTTDSEWELMFKGVAGTGVKFIDIWHGASQAVGDNWFNDAIWATWIAAPIIRRVKLSLWDFVGLQAELIFNGTGSNYTDWFTKERLISSPWQDLASLSTNYFSLDGDAREDRRFFINKNYAGCLSASGWLVVVESAVQVDCQWEWDSPENPYSIILYSKTNEEVAWNDVVSGSSAVGRAEYMTIHVDAHE